MAIDTITPRSRRTLLAGTVGGLAAAVASGLGRAQPAVAHDPDDVRLGADNSATTRTEITNTATDGTAFAGIALGSGPRVGGVSDSGARILGYSTTGTGVYGTSYYDSHAGVFGASGSGYPTSITSRWASMAGGP